MHTVFAAATFSKKGQGMTEKAEVKVIAELLARDDRHRNGKPHRYQAMALTIIRALDAERAKDQSARKPLTLINESSASRR